MKERERENRNTGKIKINREKKRMSGRDIFFFSDVEKEKNVLRFFTINAKRRRRQ
jgi:hypothetical protein